MAGRTRQIHRIVAIALGVFIALHLASHAFAWGGIAAHSAALQAVRLVYRNPAIEPLLLTAVALQVVLGLRLALSRWRSGVSGGWGRLQLASGSILAFFLLAHAGAAVSARWLGGIDTNFYWPASTLVLAPLKYGFWPYYVLAVSALLIHVACALHFNGFARMPRLLAMAALPVAITIVLPFSGAIFPVELPDDYRTYFANYADIGGELEP
jgi:succinate dehydrogenase/fumarate reductase cytochrome b subunit